MTLMSEHADMSLASVQWAAAFADFLGGQTVWQSEEALLHAARTDDSVFGFFSWIILLRGNKSSRRKPADLRVALGKHSSGAPLPRWVGIIGCQAFTIYTTLRVACRPQTLFPEIASHAALSRPARRVLAHSGVHT